MRENRERDTMIRNTLIALLAAGSLTSIAQGDLLITELRTKAQTNPEDYFELTNTGNTAIDLTGWRFDDESADLADAVALNGIGSIGAGETIIFFQLDETDPTDPAFDPAAEIAFFRSQWGGLAGVQIGWHNGAGLGKGDAISLFDASDNLSIYFEYGMTSPEQTHAGDWAAGNWDGSDIFENQAAVWVPGSNGEFVVAGDGVFGSFQNLDGDWGSPGVVPTPASIALLGFGGLAATRRRR